MADNSSGATKAKQFYCPICFVAMNITIGNYPDEPPMPTAICPECDFQALISNLKDNETKDKMIRYQLRLLLEQIAQGEKARQLINLHQLFPHDRSDQLIALMREEIPSPVDYPDNKSITPLSEEDIVLVKRILEL